MRKEDAIYTLLKCSETKKWKEEFARSKWLSRNEGRGTYINCTRVTKLKNNGKYLFKTRWRWENKVTIKIALE
jgi:hypothetical protein